jgi:hypothetical protein
VGRRRALLGDHGSSFQTYEGMTAASRRRHEPPEFLCDVRNRAPIAQAGHEVWGDARKSDDRSADLNERRRMSRAAKMASGTDSATNPELPHD